MCGAARTAAAWLAVAAGMVLVGDPPGAAALPIKHYGYLSAGAAILPFPDLACTDLTAFGPSCGCDASTSTEVRVYVTPCVGDTLDELVLRPTYASQQGLTAVYVRKRCMLRISDAFGGGLTYTRLVDAVSEVQLEVTDATYTRDVWYTLGPYVYSPTSDTFLARAAEVVTDVQATAGTWFAAQGLCASAAQELEGQVGYLPSGLTAGDDALIRTTVTGAVQGRAITWLGGANLLPDGGAGGQMQWVTGPAGCGFNPLTSDYRRSACSVGEENGALCLTTMSCTEHGTAIDASGFASWASGEPDTSIMKPFVALDNDGEQWGTYDVATTGEIVCQWGAQLQCLGAGDRAGLSVLAHGDLDECELTDPCGDNGCRDPDLQGLNDFICYCTADPTRVASSSDTDLACPTPAPPTSVPPTLDPPTSAPATPIPPTSVPPTRAPPTSTPPTATPATSTPATAAPPTRIPPTPVPRTPAPPALATPTRAPPTSEPAPTPPAPPALPTPQPQTPAPPTPEPTAPPAGGTPEPQETPAPANAAPPTPVPHVDPHPPTPVPVEPTPEPVPDTPAPRPTGVPGTRAPTRRAVANATAVPETRVPWVWVRRNGLNAEQVEDLQSPSTVATVAALLGGAGASFGLLATGRLAAVKKFSCAVEDVDLAFNETLDFEMHPTGVAVGDGVGRYLVGAIVMNYTLLVLYCCGCLAVGYVQALWRRKTFTQGLARMRSPGAAILPYMFLLPGTALVSARLMFAPESPAGLVWLGSLSLLLCCASPAALWWAVLRYVPELASLEPDPHLFPNGDGVLILYGRRRAVYKFFFGMDVWVPQGAIYFCEQYGFIFDSYRARCAWLLLAELAVTIGLSLFSAWKPTTAGACNARNTMIALMYVVFLVVMVHVRPFLSRFDNIVQVLNVGTSALPLVLMTIGIWQGETPGSAKLFDYAKGLLLANALLITAKGVWDFILYVVDLWLSRSSGARAKARAAARLAQVTHAPLQRLAGIPLVQVAAASTSSNSSQTLGTFRHAGAVSPATVGGMAVATAARTPQSGSSGEGSPLGPPARHGSVERQRRRSNTQHVADPVACTPAERALGGPRARAFSTNAAGNASTTFSFNVDGGTVRSPPSTALSPPRRSKSPSAGGVLHSLDHGPRPAMMVL